MAHRVLSAFAWKRDEYEGRRGPLGGNAKWLKLSGNACIIKQQSQQKKCQLNREQEIH
jgi:hypothetical protein